MINRSFVENRSIPWVPKWVSDSTINVSVTYNIKMRQLISIRSILKHNSGVYKMFLSQSPSLSTQLDSHK